tara:strand:- start:373 stop:609 length:237 start_codon:yes stop_codon:yes gene_type:complete
MSKRIAIGDLVRHRWLTGGIGFVTGCQRPDSAHPGLSVRFLNPVKLVGFLAHDGTGKTFVETYRDATAHWELVSSCDI